MKKIQVYILLVVLPFACFISCKMGPTEIPSKPENVRAIQKDSASITVAWGECEQAQLYNVFLDNILIGSTTSTHYRILAISQYKQCAINIQSTNSVGDSALSSTLFTRSLPGKAQNVLVSPISPNCIRISWTPPASGAYKMSYRLSLYPSMNPVFNEYQIDALDGNSVDLVSVGSNTLFIPRY